jgi:hypothetical protein
MAGPGVLTDTALNPEPAARKCHGGAVGETANAFGITGSIFCCH